MSEPLGMSYSKWFPNLSTVLTSFEVLFKRELFKRQKILDKKDSVKVKSHDMVYRGRLKELWWCGAVRRTLLHPQGTALSTVQSVATYLCK